MLAEKLQGVSESDKKRFIFSEGLINKEGQMNFL